MSVPDIYDWLEDQIEQIINVPQYHEHPSDMAAEANELKENAKAEEIALSDLVVACDGDIEKYLLGKQIAFTDAEVRRKTAKD